MTTQAAINAIRAQAGFSEQDALEIVSAMLWYFGPTTPAGEAILDLCESLRAIVENDALEAAEEAYRASPTYRQDMCNEAVARGA